ncbi:MAG: Periplasmic sensor signal transduction histidine kinase [Microgenomates group bacterium Gr01-1014_16]|nr:MAG: Periplasmic sensor signal transduction histidine kinase [Microgenomates group bacterium Gr01-1014_16]
MNFRSLSFRLSLWVILSFLAATILAFVGFYLVTSRLLQANTDADLQAHATKVADVVSSRESGMHDALAKEAFLEQFSQIPGMLVVITDSQGVVISGSAATGPDPIFYELFARAQKDRRSFFTNRPVKDLEMRLYVTPVTKNAALIASIIVAHPVNVIRKSLNSLLFFMAGVYAILVVPVAAGGYFLVRRGLSPVSAMADKIARIESSDLSQRVAVPQTSDALQELAVAFNSLLERLKQSIDRERQFIADVAHEMKTPLSTITSTAEIALTRPRAPVDYQKALQEVQTDAVKMATTLKNVLDLAWSQSTPSVNWQKFNLSETVGELAEVATKLARPRHIAVTSRIAPGIFILGQPEKIYRALLNLIDNAVKFTPAEGKISLSLISRKNQAVVEVKDTGAGIAQSDLPHIFNRFYRGSKSGRTLGSGLGLAITSSILATHGGQIKVKSLPGHGSTFTVSLPLTDNIRSG